MNPPPTASRYVRAYSVLTPPLPAALGVIRLWSDDYGGIFDCDMPEHGDPPRLLRVLGIDDGLGVRSDDGSILFTPHGGTGVLGALEQKLEESGFHRLTTEVDVDFARGLCRYQQTALALLPGVRGRGPLGILLDALNCTALPSDADRFVADWGSVRPWLSRFRVVLTGAQNVGKSTLFNRVAASGSAIVSAVAGTTRDVLSAEWALPNGTVVELLDTAGRCEIGKGTEDAAVSSGRRLTREADLVLALAASDGPPPKVNGMKVATKSDLADAPGWAEVAVSSVSGAGLAELGALVAGKLFPKLPSRTLPLSGDMVADVQARGLAGWFEAPD